MAVCVRAKVQSPGETLSSETSRVGEIAFVARTINSRILIVESANYGSLTLQPASPNETNFAVNRVSRIARKKADEYLDSSTRVPSRAPPTTILISRNQLIAAILRGIAKSVKSGRKRLTFLLRS